MILAVFVLLAIALASLVIGVQSSQDPLVFVSIGASGIAGLVLAVAFLKSRPREVSPSFDEVDESSPVVDLDESSPVVDLTESPPIPSRRPATPALPIPDYPDLQVAEVLPLLGDLERDELLAVEAYEARTRAHPWVLSRIQTLLETTGNDRSAPEASWSARDFPLERRGADVASLDPDAPGGDRSTEGVEPPPPAPVGATSPPPRPSEPAPAADEDWDGFPIADYEWLPAAEVIPLLGYLEHEELEAVRARELAEGARPEVVARIDALLRADAGRLGAAPAEPQPMEVEPQPMEVLSTVGGGEPPVAPPDPAGGPEAAVQPEAVAQPPAPGESPVREEPLPAPSLPIEGYDDLSIGELIRRLVDLETDELQQVREYEKAHRARTTILVRIDTALARR